MSFYGIDYCEHGEPAADCEVCSRQDADSWVPIDLGPYLRGEIRRPEPTVGLARSDGLRMLYPGKEHAVIGEMESGKSWYMLACAAAEMACSNHVVYVHFEESDPSDTVERLQALGCRDTEILKLFRFVGPERQVSRSALALLLDPVPSLVVFDGVNEAMSLHGWGIREEDGAAAFRRHLVKPCTKVGAATLAGDHVAKDIEKRGRTAIGSVHKVNGLSGSLVLLENADPFGRGQRGRSHVYLMKDRPGHLRRHGEATKTAGKTFMGELVVDDEQRLTPDLELKFWAPKGKPGPQQGDVVTPAEEDDMVLDAVRSITAAGKVANLRSLRAAVPLRAAWTSQAVERLLLADRLVESCGPRSARIFTEPATVSGDQLSGGVQ